MDKQVADTRRRGLNSTNFKFRNTDENGAWYYGKHELAKNITDPTKYKIVKGIII